MATTARGDIDLLFIRGEALHLVPTVVLEEDPFVCVHAEFEAEVRTPWNHGRLDPNVQSRFHRREHDGVDPLEALRDGDVQGGVAVAALHQELEDTASVGAGPSRREDPGVTQGGPTQGPRP